MTMRPIVPQDWEIFLTNLGRERLAWLATLEENGITQARNEPLKELEATPDGIRIRVGHQGVYVRDPRSVQVEECDGAPQALEIEDATGGHVMLRFRVAAPPGALDGLAPAEKNSGSGH